MHVPSALPVRQRALPQRGAVAEARAGRRRRRLSRRRGTSHRYRISSRERLERNLKEAAASGGRAQSGIRPSAPGAEAQRHEDIGLEGHLEHLPEGGCFGEIGEAVDGSRSESVSGIIIRGVAWRDCKRNNGGVHILNLLRAIYQR